MSLHRGCCPCDGCYCGTLCSSCLTPCGGVSAPAATACISKREWDNNIASVTAGSGTGWVIWVDGAYYFFDGTLSSCTETRATTVDWLISFKADECPADWEAVEMVVPFTGGWRFGDSFTITVDASGVASSNACAAQAGVGGGTSTFTDPHGWGLEHQDPGLTALEAYYGGGTTILTGNGSMTQCAFPLDSVAYNGTCSTPSPPLAETVTAITGPGGAVIASGVTEDHGEFTITNNCGSSYAIDFESADADGFFTFTADTCTIRYIGPVSSFCHYFNAVFAQTGLVAAMVSEGFLGCKVRAAYVGTVDQPTFPFAGTNEPGFPPETLLAAGVKTVALTEQMYDPLIATATFNMKVVDTVAGTGCPTECVIVIGPLVGVGWTTFGATGTHATSDGNGRVIERYGVDLHPPEWTWAVDTLPGDPCDPTGATIQVT